MQDRQSTYPGRVTLTPVPDAPNTYDMTLADIPIKPGTPLNKKNLLADSTAALLDLGSDATPNEAFEAIAAMLSEIQVSIAAAQSAIRSAQNAASAAQSSANAAQSKISNLIKYGTSDLTPGVSNLDTGSVYLVYK